MTTQKASDSQVILMEKKKNRWKLDHALKIHSDYSLTQTYPLKAVFLSRIPETLWEWGLPLPKNWQMKCNWTPSVFGNGPTLCGSHFFPVVNHSQNVQRKKFISWILLKRNAKVQESSGWDEVVMEGHHPHNLSCSLIFLGGSLDVGDIWLVFMEL